MQQVAQLVDELKKQLKDFNLYTTPQRVQQYSNKTAVHDEIILKVTRYRCALWIDAVCLISGTPNWPCHGSCLLLVS